MKMESCFLRVKHFGISSNQIYLLLQQVWVTDLLTHQLSNSVTLFHWTDDSQKLNLSKMISTFLNDLKDDINATPVSKAPFYF